MVTTLLAGCASPAPPSPAAAPAGQGATPDPAAAPETWEPPEFPAQNRPDVRGVSGAVSSDHPLATAAAYQVLREGGNAVDAAITAAAVLAVVRPHMNGVGGDAFALVYEAGTRTVHALNGSGRAGVLATPDFFGPEARRVPSSGPGSVSVPGAVAAWMDALDRFGTLPPERVLAPAIHYARDGFPVSVRLASDISGSRRGLSPEGRAQYLPDGEPPVPGTLLRNPALARTLERIAAEGKDGFYRGFVAEEITQHLEARGGYLRAPDFAAHTSTWVEPLSIRYLDHDFFALPPNTQGITQLQQMGMAKSFDLSGMGHNTSPYLHTLIELKKLAFADRDRWVADPEQADLPTERLLDPDYLRRRAGTVDPTQARDDVEPGFGDPLAGGVEIAGIFPAPARAATTGSSLDRGSEALPDDHGDTVYLTVVDAQGNAVSWIQSLFSSFGSGVFEPETGVLLQNRGALFTLEEGHPNRIAPGKRPFHTLTPLLALRPDRELAFTLGTPGGDAQTQSLLQIVNNHLLFGMTPQEAVEAPRFRSQGGLSVAIEDRIQAPVLSELARLGHDLSVVHGWTATFGGAQMIRVDPATGTLFAAADPRREAYAIAY